MSRNHDEDTVEKILQKLVSYDYAGYNRRGMFRFWGHDKAKLSIYNLLEGEAEDYPIMSDDEIIGKEAAVPLSKLEEIFGE